MKYVTLIVFTLSLVAFGHASGDVVIDGFAKYIRANENRMEMIVFELRTLDICTIANTGEKLSVRDVKLELSDEMGAMIRDADTPRLAEARFRCQIVTNDDPLNYTLAAYEDYIRLRLNGLSSPGTLKILKIWHGPKDKPRVVRMHMIPVSEFERVDKIPDVLDKMANTDYLTRHKSAKLYLFRDSDLVWLLEANEDQISCNFTDGFDGKHFHSQGFSEVFAKEFRHMGGKALSSQQLLELKARLKKSWNINWYCPSDIPIPGT